MTRSDLIAKVSSRYPQLIAKDVEIAVNAIFHSMTATLIEGHRIEIRDFGSFGINFRPPRTGRNPRTGELVSVPGRHVPHFKPGKELRERVNK